MYLVQISYWSFTESGSNWQPSMRHTTSSTQVISFANVYGEYILIYLWNAADRAGPNPPIQLYRP